MGVVALLFMGSYAQESFNPSGKGFVKVFSNFNSSFTNGANSNEFELSRAYFGYSYNLSDNFSGKVTLDVGNLNTKSDFTAFLKNALIQYKSGDLAVNFGLIGTSSFKTMEKLWGNRYIEKSFQDAYKFNSSADLGISVAYNLTDWLTADLMIVNGEGYKSVQSDNQFKTAVGATLKPVEKILVRGYYDFEGNTNTETTISGAIAYTTDNLTAAVEYNIQNNVGNTINKQMSGTSAYLNYGLGDAIKTFARFDLLTSNVLSGSTDNWNLAKDGNLIIAGVEYVPVKGLKLSPNLRYWSPADVAGNNVTSVFLNCEIKF